MQITEVHLMFFTLVPSRCWVRATRFIWPVLTSVNPQEFDSRYALGFALAAGARDMELFGDTRAAASTTLLLVRTTVPCWSLLSWSCLTRRYRPQVSSPLGRTWAATANELRPVDQVEDRNHDFPHYDGCGASYFKIQYYIICIYTVGHKCQQSGTCWEKLLKKK